MQRRIGYVVIAVAIGAGTLSLATFFLSLPSPLQPVAQPTRTHSLPSSARLFVSGEREGGWPREKGEREDTTAQDEGDTAQEHPEAPEQAGDVYTVIKVVDGDTLDVMVEGKAERVRMIGMDTPETKDTRTAVECFGREASARAEALLQGRLVSLERDESQDDRDKYKRLLRHVFVEQEGKRVNVALDMIANGYAFEYTYDIPSRYLAEYKAAEREARTKEKGLWSPSTCGGKRKAEGNSQ